MKFNGWEGWNGINRCQLLVRAMTEEEAVRKFSSSGWKSFKSMKENKRSCSTLFRASCDLPHRILPYRVVPGCWKLVPWNLTTTSFALLGYTIHRSTCIHGILTSKNRTFYFWTQAEIRRSGMLLVSVLSWISYRSQETEVSRVINADSTCSITRRTYVAPC